MVVMRALGHEKEDRDVRGEVSCVLRLEVGDE